MANICDTQYKVTGSRKAVADLWNTLQELEVNSNNICISWQNTMALTTRRKASR